MAKKLDTRVRGNREDVPDLKKFERIGENKFVIHTNGKDKFEGTYDPRRYRIVNGQLKHN